MAARTPRRGHIYTQRTGDDGARVDVSSVTADENARRAYTRVVDLGVNSGSQERRGLTRRSLCILAGRTFRAGRSLWLRHRRVPIARHESASPSDSSADVIVTGEYIMGRPPH